MKQDEINVNRTEEHQGPKSKTGRPYERDKYVHEDVMDGDDVKESDFADPEDYKKYLLTKEGMLFFSKDISLESSAQVISQVWNKIIKYSGSMDNITARMKYFAVRSEDQKKDIVLNSIVKHVFDKFQIATEDLFLVEAFIFAIWMAIICFAPRIYTVAVGILLLYCGTSFFYLPVVIAGLKCVYFMLSKIMCQKTKDYVQNSVPYPNLNLFWVLFIALVGAIPFAMNLVPGSAILTMVTFAIIGVLITHLPAIAAKSAVNNTIVVVMAIVALAFISIVSSVKPRNLWTFYNYPFAEDDALYILAKKYHEQAALTHLNALWKQLNESRPALTRQPEVPTKPPEWFYTEQNFVFSFVTETLAFSVLLTASGLHTAVMKCLAQKVASLTNKSKEAQSQITKEPEVGSTSWLGLMTVNVIVVFAETAFKWYLWKGGFVMILLIVLTVGAAMFVSQLTLTIFIGPIVDMAANASVAGKALSDGNSTFGVYCTGPLVRDKMQNTTYAIMMANLGISFLVSLATRPYWVQMVIFFGLLMHSINMFTTAHMRVKQNVALFATACGNMNYLSATLFLYQLVKGSRDFQPYLVPLAPETSGTPVVFQN